MLADLIADRARTHLDRPALIQNDIVVSYATFARAIAATCLLFANRSLPVGGLAVVWTEILADCWCSTIALRSLGIDTICVPSLARIAELGLKDVVCIVARKRELEREDARAPGIAGTPMILLPEDLWKNAARGDLGRPEGDRPPPGGHIIYTSGTTGTNKKLLIGADQEARRIARNAAMLAWPSRSVVHFSNFGLWTSTGFHYPPVAWSGGGCAIFDQFPDPFARYRKHDFICSYLTPLQTREVAKAASGPEASAGTFQIRIVGGAVSLGTVEALQRKVTANVVNTYSASECQMMLQTSYRAPGDIHWYTPEPDRTVEIVDGDGRPCADGEEGELRVRLLDFDCSSYLDDRQATARFFRDGCFHPGDLAVRRPYGRVRILGRVADVLNLGGHKRAVAPLEEKVQELLGVDHVCLFSQVNEAGENELGVAYEAASAVAKDWMETVAAGFGMFAQVHFVRLGAFPRTTEGTNKVKRDEVRRAVFGWTKR